MFIRVLVMLALLTSSVWGATTDTLILDLRLLLGQTDSTTGATNWSNPELRQLLNMAQDLLAPHSGGVQRTDTTGGGSIRYTVPADFISMKGIAWLMRDTEEVGTIPYIPVDSFYRTVFTIDRTKAGIDVHYITEDAGEVAVYPPIKGEDSLMYSYYAYPATLDTTFECEFDDGWEKVLLLYAAWLAYTKNRDAFWTQFYATKAEEQMTALRAMTTRRPQVQAVP